MSFFSIITPAYNRADLIGKTLDSVLAQDFDDWELIVVDDGSTDTTAQITQQYAARHPGRIIALGQGNAGPGAARNWAIQHASGQYVLLLDSDDLWFPWALTMYRETVEKYGSPALISGREVEFDAEGEIAGVARTPFNADYFADYFEGDRTAPRWVVPSGAVIRADALRAVGGFADRNIYAEDKDLWLKLGCSAGFVRMHSPPTVAYRRHAGSAMSNLEKVFLGMVHLLDQERHGRYPGGEKRRLDRLRIISADLRPVSVECLRQGRIGWGVLLYRRTLGWHVRLRRFRYVIAFPFLVLRAFKR
jgi:glycosyltransferase involved in cell wall biosynthesis